MEEELIEYYEKKCLDYHVLTSEEKMSIKMLIERMYIEKNAKYSFSLFDILKIEDTVAVSCFDSWSWIHDFIKDKSKSYSRYKKCR